MRVMKSCSVVMMAALIGSFTVSCAAQDWAKAMLAKSPRHGEFVTVPEASGRKLQVWVVYPQVKTKAPVVVMIHEIFGLSDWAEEMADELAGAGYIVVEPDLLSRLGDRRPQRVSSPRCDGAEGQPGRRMWLAQPGGTSAFPDRSSVVRAVSSLPDAQVLADLDAAADYGKKLPSADGKLYVVGFCWGGGKSFLFATHRSDLSGSLRLLWTAAAGRRDEEHYRAGLRVLRGQRRAHQRDDSANRSRHEGRGQNLRASCL